MEDVFVGLALFVLIFACILIMVVTFRKIFRVITVFEYEKGLRYKKGKFVGLLEPGQYWMFALNTFIDKVDTRPSYITISGQEIFSGDGISIKVSLAASYQIVDPIVACHSTQGYMQDLYLLLQVGIREVVGTATLDEILENRKTFGEKLKEYSLDKVRELGLELRGVDIKDITFNGELKKAYAQAALAKKEALASLEKARGEAATLRSLANSAKMLENNPSLLQLRILQSVGETKGNTVVLNVSDSGV